MGLLSILGVLSPVHMSLMTLLGGGKCVGRDAMGNKYYSGKLAASAQSASRRERRWVMYKGAPEATKIPPEWHGWMHYQTDVIPETGGPSYRRSWQKPHQPNLTGTTGAYRPPGHLLSGGKRAAATGDYEAWTPGSNE
jgi:NADH:ubiquinone oxidoreductase subunit